MYYSYRPLTSLHNYRSVYENDRLFRKPPLLGPPLSRGEELAAVTARVAAPESKI